MASSGRRHLFISHHHKDDSLVDAFVALLGKGGWDVRNSSIRARPANQERIDNGLIKPEVIQRLLRMKISWATTVVVLIGSRTHSRPWVNWEIAQANAQGKRIVGVFEHGGKSSDVPSNLEKYASAIVGWNAQSIKAAVDGGQNLFENEEGTVRGSSFPAVTSEC